MWLKPYQLKIYFNRQLKQTANNKVFIELMKYSLSLTKYPARGITKIAVGATYGKK